MTILFFFEHCDILDAPLAVYGAHYVLRGYAGYVTGCIWGSGLHYHTERYKSQRECSLDIEHNNAHSPHALLSNHPPCY